MAKKDSMPCNKPRPSDRAGKKKMVLRDARVVRRSLFTLVQRVMGSNYSAAARTVLSVHDTSAELPRSKLTARYWACKRLLWAGKGGSTQSSPKSRKGKY